MQKTLLKKEFLAEMEPVISLIKSEWSSIRSNQDSLGGMTRLDDSCCGILFVANHAFACNGHWIMRVMTEHVSIDPEIKCFFYNYITEEIEENKNPFEEVYGITIDKLFEMVNEWRDYNVKLRVVDVLDLLKEQVALVKDRRLYALRLGYDTDYNVMLARLESKTGAGSKVTIPVYSKNMYSKYPDFSVNMGYFYKIFEIVQPWFHVVDICFNESDGYPILIKAKNPFDPNKPDIRFVLAQFKI